MRSTVSTFVLVISLAACSGNKTPASPPTTGGGSSEPSAAHDACSADADCVVVETVCCDHCNGGKAEAFNVAFADQHKPKSCEQTACTMMACGPATAACEAGTCTVKIGEIQ